MLIRSYFFFHSPFLISEFLISKFWGLFRVLNPHVSHSQSWWETRISYPKDLLQGRTHNLGAYSGFLISTFSVYLGLLNPHKSRSLIWIFFRAESCLGFVFFKSKRRRSEKSAYPIRRIFFKGLILDFFEFYLLLLCLFYSKDSWVVYNTYFHCIVVKAWIYHLLALCSITSWGHSVVLYEITLMWGWLVIITGLLLCQFLLYQTIHWRHFFSQVLPLSLTLKKQ